MKNNLRYRDKFGDFCEFFGTQTLGDFKVDFSFSVGC
jgi:hypothetical protein